MKTNASDVDTEETASTLLKKYRLRRSLGQRQLAEKIGTNEKAVWGRENDRDTLSPALINKIAEVLTLTPQEKERLLFRWLPPLDPKWLEKQPEKERPGLLLTAYRERRGLTQAELPEALHITNRTTIALWESNRQFAYIQRMDEVAEVLGLTAEEKKRLMCARFPAFDAGWLAKQPQYQQGGLLLDAYLDQAGITQKSLVDAKIFNHANAISACVKGKKAISADQKSAVIDLLSKQNKTISFDAESFLRIVDRSNAAIQSCPTIAKTHRTQMGAAIRTHDAPELALDDQPNPSRNV